MLSSVNVGFAAEVTEPDALEEAEILSEGEVEEPAEGTGEGEVSYKEDDTGEADTDEDAENEGKDAGIQEESEEADQTAENDVEADPESSSEVSDNVRNETVDAEEAADAEDADGEAEIDSQDSEMRTVITDYFTKEYDGTEFKPGKYKVPDGAVLTDSPVRGQGNVKGNAGDTVELKAITNVSQNYSYYLYSTKTTNSYEREVSVKIEKRPVTYRSASYTKEYDGKPLSQNSAAEPENPKLVAGSLVKDQNFGFLFDKDAINYGDKDKDTSVPNKFTLSSNGTADIQNYDPTYEYGNLIITASRNNVNRLPAPTKAKATVNKKGEVKITWKKAKSYKENGKKGGKTEYRISRYSDGGYWTVISDGTTKSSFVDKEHKDGERFIYRIESVGYDSSLKYGTGETPAYVRATPSIVSVSPYDGIKAANVTFMGLGTETDDYTLQHWNNKKKSAKDEIKVNKYNSTAGEYKGKSRTVSTNTYRDQGGDNVTISVNKATFSFRVKAEETTVFSYGSKVTIPATPWSKTVKLKMISVSPVLKGRRKSDSSFELYWKKVNKATGYLLEYGTDKNFSNINNVTKSMYMDADNNETAYNDRKYVVENTGFGVPYYCRLTAYTKKKGDGGYGTALGTSPVIVEYGRQKGVKDFKAEYFEYGSYRSDAMLTWEDENEEKDGRKTQGFYLQRWSYAYNKETKKYDIETGHEVLLNYTSANKLKKTTQSYAIATGDKIKNGELIKYRVQSVVNEGGPCGEFLDGYVFSEPEDFYYMNPTAAEFTKKKFTVAKGGELTPTLKFKPKKLPKTADDLSKSEFKKKFCFNDEMEFILESDSLTAGEIKKYVTIDGSTGKLKGVKTYSKDKIKIRASSPNDPSNVYATAIVRVGGEEESSGEKDDDKKSSSLVVCIDAGHGGKDDGTTANGLVEKKLNLTIAKKVGSYLKDKGAKVYYTRSDDEYVSLTDRTDYADEKDCNLFVSIHCNYSDNSSARGTEVYYSVQSKYAKRTLAKKIAGEVAEELGTVTRGSDGGAKTREGNNGDYYSVIRTSAAKGIPGIIVEHAFLSNSSDAAALKNSDKIDAAAKAEAEAIYKYWNKD